MKTYTTKQGDMWDSIAYSQLGSTGYTDKLMALNMKYCDLYTFPAGVTLLLPEKVDEESAVMPPWKKVNK